MNFSVYSADRATHLRILVVALMASIAFVGFAISARVNSIETTQVASVGRAQKAEIRNKEAILASPARLDGHRT